MSVLDFLDDELAQLEAQHRRRIARVVSGAQGPRVVVDGREVVSFSSNDYLSLASHPLLRAAATEAVERHGVGAGSSRLIVGNSEVHAELERGAAAWLGCEATRLFNSGSAANTGLLPVLAGQGDQIFSDELNHASIIDGCRLSRAQTSVFKHKDLNYLDELLRKSTARRRVVVTESVFSMDGDRADVVALREIATRWEAIFVVDEAHGAGVFGPAGGGILAEQGVTAEATMATLGKALGVYGAVVGGPRALAEILWNRARSLVFTTGIPPAMAAAALAAIRLASGPEGDARRTALRLRIDQLAEGLRGLGLEVSAESPIVPLVIGGDREVMAWTNRLMEQGLYVQGVRPPTVPEGTSRLRIAVTAGHSADDIERLVAAIRAGLAAGARIVSRGTGAG